MRLDDEDDAVDERQQHLPLGLHSRCWGAILGAWGVLSGGNKLTLIVALAVE